MDNRKDNIMDNKMDNIIIIQHLFSALFIN